MFDTGTGDINGKGRKLFDVLFRVSIKPEPITDIVITHGHLDYIRGLVRGNKPTFSNAVVYLKKRSWILDEKKQDFSKSKGARSKTELNGMIKDILKLIIPKVKFIKDKETFLDYITFTLAPGQTPGHIIPTIHWKDESFSWYSGLIHYRASLFHHPEWGTCFDWIFDMDVKNPYLRTY